MGNDLKKKGKTDDDVHVFHIFLCLQKQF